MVLSLPVARIVAKLGYSFDRTGVEPTFIQPLLLDAVEPFDGEIEGVLRWQRTGEQKSEKGWVVIAQKGNPRNIGRVGDSFMDVLRQRLRGQWQIVSLRARWCGYRPGLTTILQRLS